MEDLIQINLQLMNHLYPYTTWLPTKDVTGEMT